MHKVSICANCRAEYCMRQSPDYANREEDTQIWKFNNLFVSSAAVMLRHWFCLPNTLLLCHRWEPDHQRAQKLIHRLGKKVVWHAADLSRSWASNMAQVGYKLNLLTDLPELRIWAQRILKRNHCMVLSGSHSFRGQTAAGLPSNNLDANASTWYSDSSIYFPPKT